MKPKNVCSDIELGEFLLACQRVVVKIHCSECHEPLTSDEIREATQEEINNPICQDCYMDYFSEKYNERKSPDEK